MGRKAKHSFHNEFFQFWQENKGLHLIQPELLLKEWANNYSLKSIPEIEAELAEFFDLAKYQYGLTGFSGAARLAPAVRYQKVTLYVSGLPEGFNSRMNLKKVPSGSNVSLLIPYDDGVLYGLRKVDEMRVVSPIQLYLDLLSLRGRGEEAAQEILDREIRPSW